MYPKVEFVICAKLHCLVTLRLSPKLEELEHLDLPAFDQILKFDIKKPSSTSCSICFLLQKADS